MAYRIIDRTHLRHSRNAAVRDAALAAQQTGKVWLVRRCGAGWRAYDSTRYAEQAGDARICGFAF